MEKESVRIDKYLWSVRLFKTRSLATDFINKDRVSINGIPLKPSRMIKKGDIFLFKENQILRTYKVKEVLDNRVGAKLVSNYLEELTPKEELERLELLKITQPVVRDRGTGRPTKKDRRDLGEFFG